MPDMKTIQDQVHARMHELEVLMEELSVEFEQLKRISGLLESTNGTTSPAPSRPRRRAAAKASAAAPRAARPQRGGNRAQQALELIAAQPGLSAADLADSMGMKRNYLYRVLPALEKQGKITKQGKGYHPATAAVAA
jgi:CRP-like cAMP-binding protein